MNPKQDTYHALRNIRQMSGNSSRRGGQGGSNDNALATPERNNMLTDETPTNLKRDAGDGSR